MKKLLYAFTFALVVLSMSCATVLQPGPDRITVSSKPDGARVLLDGKEVGKTPITVTVNRYDEAVITIKKEGYETATVDKDKVVAGWVFANILWGYGAPIALGIDLLTHNQGKYSEDNVFVELESSSKKDSSNDTKK